jgi:acyl dehydratase
VTLLTEGIAAQVGRTVTYTAPEPLGRAAFRYFARAVGDDAPLSTDLAAARAAGYRDVVAPPTFICETNQYVDGRADNDGYVGHSWDLPVEGARMIRGGHEYELFEPVHPDVVLTVTWRIDDIEEKTSSSGRSLLVVTSTAEYRDQHDTLLARNRETLIYQELAP